MAHVIVVFRWTSERAHGKAEPADQWLARIKTNWRRPCSWALCDGYLSLPLPLLFRGGCVVYDVTSASSRIGSMVCAPSV